MLPDPTTAQSIGWLCVALFGIAGGANQVVRLVRTIRGEANTDELHRRITQLEKVAEDAVGRRRAIYMEIERKHDMAKGGIEALRDELNEDIDAVRETIRNLPAEIIALIKNAR